MTKFDVTFRDYVAPSGWKLSRAMRRLGVRSEPFNYADNDGADGYSHGRTLSIRPDPRLWTVPVIAGHELAHIVLGHTRFVATVQELGLPFATIPLVRFEVEAHMVAKAVAYGLGLTSEDFNADLVQQYIDTHVESAGRPDDAIALRLANATLTILDAGTKKVIL